MPSNLYMNIGNKYFYDQGAKDWINKNYENNTNRNWRSVLTHEPENRHMIESGKWMTIPDVAKHLDCSYSKAYRMVVASNIFTHKKVRGIWMVPKKEVMNYAN